MASFFTVSEAARELEGRVQGTVRPRDISTLFYQRELRDDLCPLVGGRRLIPGSYLDSIASVLRQKGLIQSPGEEVSHAK